MGLVLLLMPVPTLRAAGPNTRSPDLGTQGLVRRVAISDDGVVLAVTDDPGSTVKQNATLPTWFVWDASGKLLRSGNADHPSCSMRNSAG